MSLKLMYITNRTDVMEIAEKYGIDRIFIDMETLGKESRQPNMDTVKSSHTLQDIKNARKVLKKTEILPFIRFLPKKCFGALFSHWDFINCFGFIKTGRQFASSEELR